MSLTKPKADESEKAKVHPLRGSVAGQNYFGKDAKLVGNLTLQGPTRIDGSVEGEIQSSSDLEVGESAVINAKITGTVVRILGTVNGDVHAKKLTLIKPAKVIGNISTEDLRIEEGVIFEGGCSMKRSATESSGSNS